MIKDQQIVAPGQENANEDVKLHAQIGGGDILYLIIINCPTHPLYLKGWVGFLFVKFVIVIPSLIMVFKPLAAPLTHSQVPS